MPAPSRQTGPALEAHFQFLLWLIPAIGKFPRSQKFLLGDRIQATALDGLENLVDATYTRERKAKAPSEHDEPARHCKRSEAIQGPPHVPSPPGLLRSARKDGGAIGRDFDLSWRGRIRAWRKCVFCFAWRWNSGISTIVATNLRRGRWTKPAV